MRISDLELLETIAKHGGKHPPRDGTRHYTVGYKTIRDVVEEYVSKAMSEINPWQAAVDAELVIAGLGIAGEATPKGAEIALKELIAWHVAVATDPAVNGGLSLQPAPALEAPAAPVDGNLLGEIIGCFDAAEAEGLSQALSETTDEHLKDLVERRLMHAYYAAIGPSMVAAPQAPAAPVGDLAKLVKQLVQTLRKAAPGNDLADKAMDYLKRQGLQGSPLRAAPAPVMDALSGKSQAIIEGLVRAEDKRIADWHNSQPKKD